jgi:hypothetical protein
MEMLTGRLRAERKIKGTGEYPIRIRLQFERTDVGHGARLANVGREALIKVERRWIAACILCRTAIGKFMGRSPASVACKRQQERVCDQRVGGNRDIGAVRNDEIVVTGDDDTARKKWRRIDIGAQCCLVV